jgi:hypothetical protein
MRTVYTHAVRKLVKSGEESLVAFGEIDGNTLGLPAVFESSHDGAFKGYTRESALVIVNKWNYVATLQNRVEFLYFLPCEGASASDLTKDPFYRAGGGPPAAECERDEHTTSIDAMLKLNPSLGKAAVVEMLQRRFTIKPADAWTVASRYWNERGL